MANPFPGMDPYLEGDLWSSVSANLATVITRQLVPKLKPKYVSVTAPSPALDDIVPRYGVEIRRTADQRFVTAIEILSPGDKCGQGGDYALKRHKLLASPAHLVEIDLLRAGERFPVGCPLPSMPYFVFLSRVNQRPEAAAWPIALAAPLPVVPIPLDAGDPDVALDLQAALSKLHDEMGYDLSVNYTRPPPGPLAPDEAVWVDERLRAAGRRT
jgi:hypothetical protein